MTDLEPPIGTRAKLSVPTPGFEETPLTRVEYITALVHLYRGEVGRATRWRMRLDITTNWAILSVTALVTFSLGEPSHSHAAILVGMGLVYTFMIIEARRYRFYDVWQHRVRLLERNFYVPLIRRDLKSPTSQWSQVIADDLLRPRFRMSRPQALRSRLARNYFSLFLILLATWLLKLALHPELGAFEPWLQRMAIGGVPWHVPLAFVVVLYAHLVWLLARVRKSVAPEEAYGEAEREPGTLLDL